MCSKIRKYVFFFAEYFMHFIRFIQPLIFTHVTRFEKQLFCCQEAKLTEGEKHQILFVERNAIFKVVLGIFFSYRVLVDGLWKKEDSHTEIGQCDTQQWLWPEAQLPNVQVRVYLETKPVNSTRTVPTVQCHRTLRAFHKRSPLVMRWNLALAMQRVGSVPVSDVVGGQPPHDDLNVVQLLRLNLLVLWSKALVD